MLQQLSTFVGLSHIHILEGLESWSCEQSPHCDTLSQVPVPEVWAQNPFVLLKKMTKLTCTNRASKLLIQAVQDQIVLIILHRSSKEILNNTLTAMQFLHSYIHFHFIYKFCNVSHQMVLSIHLFVEN